MIKNVNSLLDLRLVWVPVLARSWQLASFLSRQRFVRILRVYLRHVLYLFEDGFFVRRAFIFSLLYLLIELLNRNVALRFVEEGTNVDHPVFHRLVDRTAGDQSVPALLGQGSFDLVAFWLLRQEAAEGRRHRRLAWAVLQLEQVGQFAES